MRFYLSQFICRYLKQDLFISNVLLRNWSIGLSEQFFMSFQIPNRGYI